MKVTTRVIFNDEEWQSYKRQFIVGSQMHSPSDPPSFPVLVTTTVVNVDYGVPGREEAQHSFIEARDLRRILGLE